MNAGGIGVGRISSARGSARASLRAFAAAAGVGVCASLCAGAAADVTVFLRGEAQPVTAASAFGDVQGLEIRTGAGADEQRSVLPWDFVRAVEGQTGTAGLGEYLDLGEDLWRARIRIERGDFALAKPMLAKHWTRFRGADGPTAALVAEALLRCALADGDVRAAADPWLACLRHRGARQESRFPGLAPVIDAESGLLPELSPFMPAARRGDLIAACEAATGAGTGEAGEVAALIVRIAKGTGAAPSRAAAADAAANGDGTNGADARRAAPALRALALVDDIASAADARALDKAVAAFDRAYQEPPSYLAAWRIAAIGTCRARLARATAEPARADALARAALELLAVPAAGLDRTGLVDAYALEEAARLLREAGDDASAAQVDALAAERLSENASPGARP
jgi:hypothetical protein